MRDFILLSLGFCGGVMLAGLLATNKIYDLERKLKEDKEGEVKIILDRDYKE